MHLLSDILAWQAAHGLLLIIGFPAAIALYVVILSKMHYSPFAIIESKEIVSGNKTEHCGVWRAGLEVAFGLKTFVLLYAFVLIFIGPMPFVLVLALMLVMLLSLSFICAFCPMLSPYDTVTIQSLTMGVVAVYIGAAGVMLA